MRIALAHDSFTQEGGAERVVEIFHQIFPEAPVFTLVLDKKNKNKYRLWDIRTSWLQVLYNFVPKLQYLLPLIPLAVNSLNFEGYDVVLSSSSSFIKNIKVPKACVHVCYCHTPTRFLWSDPDYVNQEVPAVIRPLAKIFLSLMKKWDLKGAGRVDYFIANSQEVQKRIQRYYKRTSTLVHPAINTGFFHSTAQKTDYFLVVGRLQAHKKNELIVEIFNDLGLPLHVVGTGRQEQYLRSIAKGNIRFLGRVSDEKLRDEYSAALALINPQVEDFGLTPLEAAACGTPTIGIAKGGNLETIVPGVTGELYGGSNVAAASGRQNQTMEANGLLYREQIKDIILSWNPQKYSADKLRQHADEFNREIFKEKILEFINSKL